MAMSDDTTPNTPPKPIKLPKLRQGISVSFSDYDRAGKPHWVIHDGGRNKFFIIGWKEYEILQRWDIGTAEALVNAVNSETTLEVDLEDLDNLVKFLGQNYLLKQSGYQIHQSAKEQELFKNDNLFHWLITYYLFFRIPLVHPDKFLKRTLVVAKILFSRTLFYVMSCLGIIAIYQISVQWDTFTHTFSTLVTWQGFLLYMIVFAVCKLIHELGHAYMCRSYGIPVPTLGVAFLVFFPVLYTDTTLSWSLNSRARMRIALAGIWIEAYITIIAALIWANSHDITLQSICYLVVAVNFVASVLINVSPFMRFDGYYVLADYLKMPNLQPRAFALTRWELRRVLFGWDNPPPEKFKRDMHITLVAYSLITWIYRLTLYIGIAVLVYHFFVKILGIILFIIELYYFILSPFVNEARTWLILKDRFRWNIHTIVTLSIAVSLVIYFFLPINQTVKLPATISYSHRFLVATNDGMIANDPPAVGSKVKTNQPLIVIDSDSLNDELLSTYLSYKKSVSELRRSSVTDKYSHQRNVLLSSISKEQAKYEKLEDTLKIQTITAPFDGVIVELSPNTRKGNMVMKNEWLGDIIQPDNMRIEAFSNQVEMSLIKKNTSGYFYPKDLGYKRVPVSVALIEVLNSNELNCQTSQELKQSTENDNLYVETPCYNASELGGEIPTYITDEGKYVPVNSVYRIILTSEKPVKIEQVERGTVVLKTESTSYAQRTIYFLKKLVLEQSGF
jgi:putative peptide zinc metalloprotease protein